jgi:hypothetical protein
VSLLPRCLTPATDWEFSNRARNAVPRLWPSPWPRVAASGRQAKWRDGFQAEFWSWGSAAGNATFAWTLSLKMFFAIVAASIGLFWVSSAVLQKS